jgi:hypothetical protein
MADMINLSRLSNGMRAAGLMRRALTEALFVARRRVAFGKRLVEMPLMRRQLLKIMVAAEAARSVLFFTAGELERADKGDEASKKRVRILTPLLKFRACRDARRVTGDAMEVRGGIGYIEEWSDARLLRDAHLGSIWEGTSNIVALDVLRAIGKEDALEALDFKDSFFQKAKTFARSAEEPDARQAASALYYASAAAIMREEAAKLGDRRRALLADLLVAHKLEARDPFKPALSTHEEALLTEEKIPQ